MGIIQYGLAQRAKVAAGGAVIGPFFPTSLPNLEEYYDARSLLSLNHADPVHSWPDLSGKGRTMTDAGTPKAPFLLKTAFTSPKGQPRVHWDNTNAALGSGTLTMPLFTNGYTMYTGGLFAASATNEIIWQSDLGQPQLIYEVLATTSTGFRDNSVPNSGIHSMYSTAFTSGGEHQFAFVFNPPDGTGLCKLYVDGTLVASAVWDFNYLTPQSTELGNNPAFNSPLFANMDYFIWYSNAHTAAQVSAFSLWHRIYWGY